MKLQSHNMSMILMMDIREAFALQQALTTALSQFTQLNCDVAARGGKVSDWVSAQSVGPFTYEQDGKMFPSTLTVAVATPDLL